MLREDARVFRLWRYPKLWWRKWRRPSQITHYGVKLDLGSQVSPAIRRDIYASRYERGEARWLIWEIEPDDIVMEIGAGMGFLSALAALHIGSDRVFAFEANPAMIPVIQATYELNGVRPEVVNASLADREGMVRFYVEEDFVMSSVHRQSASAKALAVPQLEVNREIARIGPTFMVIDVEGAESDLVSVVEWQGVRKLIIDLHPHLYGELGAREVVSTLEAEGFEVDEKISTTNKKLLRRFSATARSSGQLGNQE